MIICGDQEFFLGETEQGTKTMPEKSQVFVLENNIPARRTKGRVR